MRDDSIRTRSAPADRDEESRAAPLAPSTLNAEGRTVNVTAATETPVPMYDWARDAMVPEVLLMDGVELPESRSVPLLDSHSRFSTSSILGSAENLRVENRELVSTARFSSTAEDAFTKVREGHLKDLSVGYKVLARRYVPPGSSEKINGREFTGPVNVVTKWSVREVSFTPIGADQKTKVRGNRSFQESDMWFTKMVREFLESRGMPTGFDEAKAREWLAGRGMPADCEAINAWIDENEDKVGKRREPDSKPPVTQGRGSDGANTGNQFNLEDAIRKIRDEERAAKKKLKETIVAECKRFGLDDMVEDIARNCEDEAEVHRSILEQLAVRQKQIGAGPALRLTAGREQGEKFSNCMRTALIMRSLNRIADGGVQIPGGADSFRFGKEQIDKYLPKEQREEGWEQYANVRMRHLAEMFVEQMGIRTFGMDPTTIAMLAMGFQTNGLVPRGARSDGSGFHTTGSFPNITMDAINKTILGAYSEYMLTWRMVGRQAESVPDFKQIRRVAMSESPNIDMWTGNGSPNEIAFRDEKESYGVECYSNIASFDYKSIVNDDMSALTRVPQLMAIAMARTINAMFWASILANPTMADGQALFSAVTGNRFRLNLTTGAGAPSVSTLQTLTNLMMQMRGRNQPGPNGTVVESESILGVTPRFIVGPSALSTTIKQLVLSAYDPANANMTYNTATELLPVIEPLLDANSTTAWYLFADSRVMDTVEVTFLQGQETPQTNNWMDPATLSQKYSILQSAAAKPIDYRGLQKHAGA